MNICTARNKINGVSIFLFIGCKKVSTDKNELNKTMKKKAKERNCVIENTQILYMYANIICYLA